MNNFLETTCIKNFKIFHTYSFTKQSFVHEQCSSVEELFSHSVAIRDMESYVSISKQIFGGKCYE